MNDDGEKLAMIDEATTPLQTEYLARHEGMKEMTFAEFVEWYVDEHNRLLKLDFSVSLGSIHDELAALRERVRELEAALRPFAECGLFFRLSARDKDTRNLRSYSGTFSTEMVNPIDALKVAHFLQALQALKDEFS